MAELLDSLDSTNDMAKNKGWTPLACASQAGDVDRMMVLLGSCSGSVNIDERDHNGCTAIALAAHNGHTKAVEQLLAQGANPNLRDLQEKGPLWHAASQGHTSVAGLLLDSGKISDANVRSASAFGSNSETPLAVAMRNGHVETAELLASADGIDPLAEVTMEKYVRLSGSALELAIGFGYEGMALTLLDHVDLGSIDGDDSESVASSDDTTSSLDSEESASAGPSKKVDSFTSKLLVLAACAGCLRIAQKLLEQHGADVNALHVYCDFKDFIESGGKEVGYVGESPLYAACRRGHSSIVRLLFDHKEIQPDHRFQGKYPCTALAVAAREGSVDAVKMLAADARVELDGQDSRGRTALSYAAEYGHEAVVSELLATGSVDVNRPCNYRKYTPLMYALKGSSSDGWQARDATSRMLLNSGHVDVSCRGWFGEGLLYFAADCGGMGLVTRILEHLGTDMDDEQWRMLLFYGAQKGRADLVQMLLDAPVQSDSTSLKDDAHETLWRAVSYRHESVIKVLRSKIDIDLNLIGEGGTTLLLTAVKEGSIGIVEELVQVAGIDPNTQDDEGWTALCLAANQSYQPAEMLKVLAKVPGIDPNISNNLGRTALSLAAEHARLDCVEILLEIDGIDPDAPDIDGRSPLAWALESRDVKTNDILTWDETSRRKEVVRRLLAIPIVDPNTEDVNGLTPLLRAVAMKFSGEFVDILIARPDLDVNRRGRNGLSPLALAKQGGNTVTIALLQGRGAIASDEDEISDAEGSVPAPVPSPVPVITVAFEQGIGVATSDGTEITDGEIPGEELPGEETLEGEILGTLDYPDSDTDFGLSPSNQPFGSPGELERALVESLQLDVSREYRLILDAQEEYISNMKQATEGMGKLCDVCADIDLDDAFGTRYTDFGGHLIANLGRVDKTWAKRDCPLCRLIAPLCPRPDDGDGGEHKLVSVSMTGSWLCRLVPQRLAKLKGPWVDTMALSVVSGPDWQGRTPNLSAGFIGRLGSNCPEKKNAVTIPRLIAQGGDSAMALAKSWIECCRECHTSRCNPHKLAPVPHFRLIHCTTRRIIRLEDSAATEVPLYVALSYVWGQAAASQPQPQQQQQILGEEGSGSVAATIEDAIRVTLELGYEYLWVDQYCVVQIGNEAIKMEQLRHMHTVYANAEVTLIAAAGTSAAAGLPGSPGRPRSAEQPSVLLSGHALVCIPPDPTHHIVSDSTWAERAWTYQEGMFARRRLFFSDHEISYECRDMLCREAVRLPRSMERLMSGHSPRLMVRHWMYKPYRLPGLRPDDDGTGLFDLLEEYTVRKLSFPSDTLNAMLGILQLFAKKEAKPIYHVCGVPILCLRVRSSRRVDLSPLDGFINGLCWDLKQPAHRRLGFPSWSWTGWHGVVGSMHEWVPLLSRGYGHSVDVSIICRGVDIGAVPWTTYYDQLSTADEKSKDVWSGQQHVLEITGSAVTVHFRETPWTTYNTRGWIGTVCIGDSVWEGGFSPTRKDHDDNDGDESSRSLHVALLEKPWVGIVLGASRTNRQTVHYTYVLVIREQEQQQSTPSTPMTWERIGLLKLESHTRIKGMLERRAWRLA